MKLTELVVSGLTRQCLCNISVETRAKRAPRKLDLKPPPVLTTGCRSALTLTLFVARRLWGHSRRRTRFDMKELVSMADTA